MDIIHQHLKLIIFELDKKEMIEDKLNRIDKAKLDITNIIYVKTNFNCNWLNDLLNNSYNTHEKTFCSMLGISYYLDKDIFKNIIKELSNIIPKGSSVLFDYHNNFETEIIHHRFLDKFVFLRKSCYTRKTLNGGVEMSKNYSVVESFSEEIKMVQMDYLLENDEELKAKLDEMIKNQIKFSKATEIDGSLYLGLLFMGTMVTGCTEKPAFLVLTGATVAFLAINKQYSRIKHHLKTKYFLADLNDEVEVNSSYLDLMNSLVEEGSIEKNVEEDYFIQDLYIENEKYLEGEVDDVLSKEETKYQLCYEIYIYSKSYNLKEISINQREWDTFIDVMYGFFEQAELKDKFYDYMASLLRYTISLSFYDEGQVIDVNLFIKALVHLKKFGVLDQELNYITSVLTSSLDNKVIELSEYKRIRK